MALKRLDQAITRALARPYLIAAYRITHTKPGLPQSNQSDIISLWLALRPRQPRDAKPDFASQFDQAPNTFFSRRR